MLNQQLRSLYTITYKEIRRFIRIWTQTLLPPVINQTLYFLIFGSFIGSQIGDLDGFSYMQFIVPGLIMMSVISSSFANVVGSFYIAKFQRSIEEILVSPSSNLTIILGYILGGVCRGMFVGFLVFLVSAFFTPVQLHSPLTAIIFTLLTSILFSMLALINAIYAKNFDHTSIVTTFVLTPLTYLGGVFYSIDRLPQVWQNISQFNPIVYMIDGIRYGFLGINTYSITTSLLVIIALLLLTTAAAFHLISKSHGLRS